MNLFWFLKPKITYQSKINGTITIGVLQGNKALFSGGVTQSGGEIQPMWDTVIAKLYKEGYRPRNILILGVGGGSVFQAIRKHDQTASITGIELDPVMKQVAMEQFYLEENKKQRIIITDAIRYLYKETEIDSYDLVIVDLYIGPLNPAKSRSKLFIQRLKDVLKSKGIVLYNAHYQEKNKKEYKTFRHILDTIFHDVEEVFSYPLNRVLQLYK